MSNIALITGASAGLGEELARLLLQKGWVVIGVARNEAKLKQLHSEFAEIFHFRKCDVSDPAQIKKVSDDLKRQHLFPSLFFLNAGRLDFEGDGALEMATHRQTLDTNYFGTMGWIEQWLPHCLKEGGTFVGFSSILAQQASPHIAAYCASKGAIKSAFEAL